MIRNPIPGGEAKVQDGDRQPGQVADPAAKPPLSETPRPGKPAAGRATGRPLNVLIVDGLHDSDRGGAGIVAGLIDSLRTVAADASRPIRLGLVYRYSADDARFAGAARHTRARYPELAIHPNPIRTDSPHRGIRRKLDLLWTFLRAVATLALPAVSSDGTIRAIREADLVISKGGHFYQSHVRNPLVGFVSTLLSASGPLLALRLGRPLALVAHSVGPLENCASRGIVRYVFSKACFASTREEISRAILARMGIDPARIELIPDTAFAVAAASRGELDHYLSRKGLRGKRFAVVTARFWSFPGHGDEEAARRYRCYLDALAAMSDHVVEQRVADVVLLVVHNDGQHISFENDARPVGQVHASMRHKDHATVVADDLSPAMQAALYGAAVLTIGTRMHSVIFALSAGGIATAVAYNHKTDGVMDMLGLGEYVLPIDSITPGAATAMVDRVLADRAAVTARAQDAIAEFRVTIKDALRRILLST